MFVRQRTALPAVLYGLYLVALGLSFRCASSLSSRGVMWLSGAGFRRLFRARCRVSMFLLDETAVMVEGLLAWVWVAYEPFSKRTPRVLAFLEYEQRPSWAIPTKPYMSGVH